MNLGRRLTELRLKKSQSLQQVADAVGVSKAHIWEMEKGRADNPSMALVQRLAEHFGVSIGFLLDEDMDAPDANANLAKMFRQARQLNDTEIAILDDMVQSLLKRRKKT